MQLNFEFAASSRCRQSYGIDTHLNSEENDRIGNLLKIPFQKYRPPVGSKFYIEEGDELEANHRLTASSGLTGSYGNIEDVEVYTWLALGVGVITFGFLSMLFGSDFWRSILSRFK